MNTFIAENLTALLSFLRNICVPLRSGGLLKGRWLIIILLSAILSVCVINLTSCSKKVCPAYSDVYGSHK